MILNRQHWPWAAFVLAATGAAVLLFVANYAPEKMPIRVPLPDFLGPVPPMRGKVGGTPLGLIFGGAAYVIFLFAALYGLRRKRPTWRLGRIQTWLKAHVWLTILTVPLVVLHCDFSAGGPMTQWLLGLYAFVMVSGFYGLALQQFLPRLMKDNLPVETVFEQVPHLRQQLFRAAEKLRQSLESAAVASASAGATPSVAVGAKGPDPAQTMFKEALDQQILPYLAADRGEKLLLGGQQQADQYFRSFKISVPAEMQGRVEDLQAWCNERRQLDRQSRMQHWLHAWLLIHAPASFVLVILTAWHAVITVVYF